MDITVSCEEPSFSQTANCRASTSNCSQNSCASLAPTAGSRPAKSTRMSWKRLVELLGRDEDALETLLSRFELLSISPARLSRAKQADGRFRALVAEFGAQNCIRAVSVVRDCSHMKKNQYKWMFQGLTLGAAIDSLVRESRYLFRSLSRQDGELDQFLRLLNNWVDYLVEIHGIPRDAELRLRPLIVESVGLLLNLTLV